MKFVGLLLCNLLRATPGSLHAAAADSAQIFGKEFPNLDAFVIANRSCNLSRTVGQPPSAS